MAREHEVNIYRESNERLWPRGRTTQNIDRFITSKWHFPLRFPMRWIEIDITIKIGQNDQFSFMLLSVCLFRTSQHTLQLLSTIHAWNGMKVSCSKFKCRLPTKRKQRLFAAVLGDFSSQFNLWFSVTFLFMTQNDYRLRPLMIRYCSCLWLNFDASKRDKILGSFYFVRPDF